jgi:hypothetical protein
MGEYIEESRSEYVSVSKSKRGGLGLGDKIKAPNPNPNPHTHTFYDLRSLLSNTNSLLPYSLTPTTLSTNKHKQIRTNKLPKAKIRYRNFYSIPVWHLMMFFGKAFKPLNI